MFRSVTKAVATIVLLLVVMVLTLKCLSGAGREKTKESPLQQEQPDGVVSVERGKHLVIGGACHDCHSPKVFTEFGPKVDSSRILSGHPADGPIPPINADALKPGSWVHFSPDLTTFVGPWGMTHAANITSDSATGIGAWSEENFVKAIRTGKHMGIATERPIMPPMPWDNYNNLSDNDLKSIFAYLKTTKPIQNRVHAPYSPDEVRQLINGKR